MTAGKPIWTSATFLLYVGGITVIAGAGNALGFAGGNSGKAGFAGWALAVLLGLVLVALAFRRAGNWLVAGIFGFTGVVAWAVFLGALAVWWGWVPGGTPFRGFHLGALVLELFAVAGALAAVAFFRFPLIVLPVCFYAWFFLVDLLSGGGNWSAIVSLLAGVLFFAIGLRLDAGDGRLYGFWPHATAGLAAGGALLFFWYRGDWRWVLAGLASVGFVAVAKWTGRSSWAVFGALGLLETADHFATRAAGNDDFSFFPYFPYTLVLSDGRHPWAPGLVYAVTGLVLVVLGLLVGRGLRQTAES